MLRCQSHIACLMLPGKGRTATALLSNLPRPALWYIIIPCKTKQSWNNTIINSRVGKNLLQGQVQPGGEDAGQGKLHIHCFSGKGPICIFY